MNAASPAWLASSLQYLVTPRQRDAASADPAVNRFGWPEGVVLALYAAILAFAIPHHRPWCDEAQAWLLARDCSLHDLLLRRMHYEGGPGLWPTILWIAIRLHLPFAGLNWLAGTFALGGIALLLRFSPFPRIFRYLLPFTFFLQYQYAVIARPYVLFPALLFLVCTTFTLRRPRPLLFAVCAGLMANIGLHAAFVAGGFALLYVHRVLRQPAAEPSRRGRLQLLAPGAGVFALFALAAVIVAFPAPDAAIAGRTSKPLLPPSPLLTRFMPPEQLPPGAPPLDPAVEPTAPPSRLNPILVQSIILPLLTLDDFCFPVARSNLLAVAFLSCLFFWLRSRRSTSMLLPCLLAVLGSLKIWVYDHHTGIFLFALVAAVWIALEAPRDARPANRRIDPIFSAVALTVLVLQIGWSAHCILTEREHPYDPGREVATYLSQHFAGKRIAGFEFEDVTVQVYSDRNLFINQQHAYWIWSVPVLIDRRRGEALAQRPDVVVLADFISQPESLHNQWAPLAKAGVHPYAQMFEFWQQHGYHITHRFCGDRLARLGVAHTVCENILEPNDPRPTTVAALHP